MYNRFMYSGERLMESAHECTSLCFVYRAADRIRSRKTRLDVAHPEAKIGTQTLISCVLDTSLPRIELDSSRVEPGPSGTAS